MRYFVVTARAGEDRSLRKTIAGPFGTLAPMLEVLDRWLDQRAGANGQRYQWWIDQEGPDHQLVIEVNPKITCCERTASVRSVRRTGAQQLSHQVRAGTFQLRRHPCQARPARKLPVMIESATLGEPGMSSVNGIYP